MPQLFDADGQRLSLEIQRIEQVTTGDVCCVYVVPVEIPSQPFLKLQLRIEAWPTAGLVNVETRLRNTRRAEHKSGLWDLGDPGSFHFRGLHVEFHMDSEGTGPGATTVRWKADASAAFRKTESLKLLQRGSGGPAFDNKNHRDADGNSTVSSRGYRVDSADGVFRGLRAEPVVSVSRSDSQLTVAMPDFWQQFPSGISATDHVITAELFPLSNAECFELQGGEQKTHSAWFSTQRNDQLTHFDWTYKPPRLLQPTSWIKQANVFDWLPTRSANHGDPTKFDAYISEATSGHQSFSARRDRADEYGWRHYGDVHADHEQSHYDGYHTLASHYNNQFDLIFGGILNLATSEDPKWFDLFEPLARHVMDVDIYHTTEDRACFNGGLFWHTDHFVDAHTCTHRTYSKHNDTDGNYGGGPSNEHNYTSGLLHYYFLTGSSDAYESVVSLADWVIAMDDGTKTVFAAFDSGPTGLASQTVFEDFHGPGRGAGNSINALVDAWTLTRESKYLRFAETLIRRVVHPHQSCHELHLHDAEGHWSYTVCMLAIGRYLSAKLEADQRDESYAYARESLANIGRWMAENERTSLSQSEKLEYPTVAWAAQEFRKANVLRIAASCTDSPAEESAMRRKADELNDDAWKEFYSFGQSHLTARCLSIVMTEGLRDEFHRTCQPEYLPPSPERYDWGIWQMFVPQKLRVKRMLQHPVGAVKAATRLLNPFAVARTISALKRQF